VNRFRGKNPAQPSLRSTCLTVLSHLRYTFDNSDLAAFTAYPIKRYSAILWILSAIDVRKGAGIALVTHAVAMTTDQTAQQTKEDGDIFECNICFCTARDPVVNM
jgi:hypothetical protein